YVVKVTTGKQLGAGTDADVFITIYGTKGDSEEMELTGGLFNRLKNNFEMGKTDQFTLNSGDVGDVTKIKIRKNNKGILSDWNLDSVKVEAPKRKKYIFICDCVLSQETSLFKELYPGIERIAAESTDRIYITGGGDGIFKKAAHCWPFNREIEFNKSPDLRGGFPAIINFVGVFYIQDGARIADSVSRGKVASTYERGSWIDLGDLTGKCISDPSFCRKGITMMFWGRIDESDILNNPSVPKVILSSGGGDSRSKGFSFFYEENSWTLRVADGPQIWITIISRNQIPLGKWFSFAFTWKKESGLRYFVNGVAGLKKSEVIQAPVWHLDEFNDFTISKPNSNNRMEEMLPMKIDQLATWGLVLNERTIKKAFNEGGGVPLREGVTANLLACNTNPCRNGGTCKIDADEPSSYRCVCPWRYTGLHCEIEEEVPMTSTSAPTGTSAGTKTIPTGTGPRSTPTATPTSTQRTSAPTGTSAGTKTMPTTKTGAPTTGTGPRSTPTATPTSTPRTSGPTSTSGVPAALVPGKVKFRLKKFHEQYIRKYILFFSTKDSVHCPSQPTLCSERNTVFFVSLNPSGGDFDEAGNAPGTERKIRSILTWRVLFWRVFNIKMEVIIRINGFRHNHGCTDVDNSEKLSQIADQWAKKIAAEGTEKIDPTSPYGQLVCSHSSGSNIAKACVVKWYGAVQYFDWAEPKLTPKSSPFTQLVWKKNTEAGVGFAKGGGLKRNNVASKYYVVVLFNPGQGAKENIKENVLPATGISEPAPQATCPEGYAKLPHSSRSCFSLKTTPLNWEDALYGCALDNGTLASLQSKEESDLVLNLIIESKVPEAWIGLHDPAKESRYVWVDGSSIPFSEWLEGEPNGNRSENCIVHTKQNYFGGWADKNCLEAKAFVCEVSVPGYITYKFTFNLTEPSSQNYQSNQYPVSLYPGVYTACTPYVQSGNDLLRDTLTRYFQAKNIAVHIIVNTIGCMPNGLSFVEVVVKLGPEAGVTDSISSLQTSIKQNDGELQLSNGASAKLISVGILTPGVSYCPSHCVTTFCQPGCDSYCCSQSTGAQYPSVVIQQPRLVYSNTYPLQRCPLACTSNTNYCPPYCSASCCKRRINIHRL
ncbi:unnamed protein product, partial [Porites evermanni]